MKKKFIIYMLLSLMILGKVFAQEETPQIKILNRGFMKSPNMYVRLKAPSGWIVDDNFAQWAGYLIGFLPTDAYGNDGDGRIVLFPEQDGARGYHQYAHPAD